jgi:hypothetical protein
MKAHAQMIGAAEGSRVVEDNHAAEDLLDEELVMHLERDQFVSATSQRVPRAALSRRASAGLWALRVFVLIVSAMVVYTFIDQLH